MLTVRGLAETRDLLFNMARKLLQQNAQELQPAEYVALMNASGRILSGPVRALRDVPAFNRSLVDGYAVRAADTFGASESLPAILRYDGDVKMGSSAGHRLEPGTCQAVPTGGQIPEGADAMIMIEEVDDFGDGNRYMNRSVPPGSYLVFQGDDIRQNESLLSDGIRLEPRHMAALAVAGLDSVSVRKRLRVAVLSTGDELVEPGRNLAPGQIHDINQVMLSAMIRGTGSTACHFGIIPDNLDQLQATVRQALQSCDVVVISGGSSVGARDHVAAAIDAAGQPGILQHGVAVKPGKPTIIGLCGNRPVLGLPGHPIAAWFMAMQLLVPLLFWLQGMSEPEPKTVQARLSQRVPSNHGREEFILVQLSTGPLQSDPLSAIPLFTKSGLITLLGRCDGYISIARDCEGLDEGSSVAVVMMSPTTSEGDWHQWHI